MRPRSETERLMKRIISGAPVKALRNQTGEADLWPEGGKLFKEGGRMPNTFQHTDDFWEINKSCVLLTNQLTT